MAAANQLLGAVRSPKLGSAQEEPRQTLDLIGQIVAERYRIERQIGEGGYGAVFLAEQVAMGRKVAIKVIHPNVANNADVSGRFMREAKSVARLRHPNVVQCFDFGRHGGSLYLAMEYIEGETLAALVRREGKLTPELTAHIAAQVCGALDEAHGFGVVHRDLKPNNVLLTQIGHDAHFSKIIDFGLARSFGTATDGLGEVTATGHLLGTPAFMSPEQLKGEPLDHRTDIYSLGVMLFFMLTGQRPFNAENDYGYAYLHISQPPPSLRKLSPKVSASVERIVLRCLAKERDGRPKSAGELASQLLAATGTRSHSAYVSGPAKVKKPKRAAVTSAEVIPMQSPRERGLAYPAEVENATTADFPAAEAGGRTGRRLRVLRWVALGCVGAAVSAGVVAVVLGGEPRSDALEVAAAPDGRIEAMAPESQGGGAAVEATASTGNPELLAQADGETVALEGAEPLAPDDSETVALAGAETMPPLENGDVAPPTWPSAIGVTTTSGLVASALDQTMEPAALLMTAVGQAGDSIATAQTGAAASVAEAGLRAVADAGAAAQGGVSAAAAAAVLHMAEVVDRTPGQEDATPTDGDSETSEPDDADEDDDDDDEEERPHHRQPRIPVDNL